MKTMKILFLFGFLGILACAGTPACGQGTKNTLQTLSKGFRINAAKVTAGFSGGSASVGQVQKVAGNSLSAPQNPLNNPERINTAVARFANKYKRPLFKMQTAVGISPRKAATNLYRLGALPSKRAGFPRLQTHKQFTVQDFSDLGYPDGLVPQVPFFPHPHYMYRGLGLAVDGAAVRNILEKGLLVKDVGPDHNTLRLSYASQGGRGALHVIATERVINLTSSPALALHYAERYQSKGMLVLVVIKDKVHNDSILTTPHDISPQEIQAVAALLSIKGKPVWCQIELAENGFLVTPYVPVEK